MKNIQFIIIVALLVATIAVPYFITPKRKKCGCNSNAPAVEEIEDEE